MIVEYSEAASDIVFMRLPTLEQAIIPGGYKFFAYIKVVRTEMIVDIDTICIWRIKWKV